MNGHLVLSAFEGLGIMILKKRGSSIWESEDICCGSILSLV